MSIDEIKANEKNDRDSTLAMIKSLASQVEAGNYNSAISSLSSIAIFLASAESNSRLVRYMREQK